MNPIHLQNKIERLLSELYEKCPKKFHNRSCRLWSEWIGTNSSNAIKILNKYKAKYIGQGATRIAIEIPHSGKKYVIKLCYRHWDDDDENYIEILAIKKLNKSIWLKSLILPIVLQFHNDLVGWISVWPKAIVYDELSKPNEKNEQYNNCRWQLFSDITSDAHEGNIAFWKGYLWLIDLNINDTSNIMLEIAKDGHKKLSKLHRKSYLETSRLVKYS